MAVFKVEKTKNFTIMSNHHLQNKNLSLKAKGLLSYMLSLPDDWDYSLAGLVVNSKESKTPIRNTLNELKEHHYLSIIIFLYKRKHHLFLGDVFINLEN